MDIFEVMKLRHSVRSYKENPIEDDKRKELQSFVDRLNKESGLHIQLIYDDKNCFDSFMGHYGSFKGVNNYVAVVGKKSKDLDEVTGYYGEKLVLKMQEMGINTCWVALTHGKTKAQIGKGEKLSVVISFGYGETQGREHHNKPIEDLAQDYDSAPDWFKKGVDACLMAPTAIHQQKFYLYLDGDIPKVKCFFGPFSKMDLGIVKYHFEAVTGKILEKA